MSLWSCTVALLTVIQFLQYTFKGIVSEAVKCKTNKVIVYMAHAHGALYIVGLSLVQVYGFLQEEEVCHGLSGSEVPLVTEDLCE